MAEKKNARPTFTTPRGVFVFPRLGTPDTKFKEAGEYSVKVRLAKDVAEPLLAKLRPLHKQAVEHGKKLYKELKVDVRKKFDARGGLQINPLFNVVYDDNEKETGEIDFVFKMTASGVSKKTGKAWKRSPAVFDAKMNRMDGNKVWGGSEGKVTFEVGVDMKTGTPGYFIPGTGSAGLKLQLEAVQVLHLVQGGQRDAAAYGFEAEEGFEDDGSTTASETTSESTETSGDEPAASEDAETDF